MSESQIQPGSHRFDDCCSSGRQESLMRIYHYLDGELSTVEISAIREHLDSCYDCREEYAVESLLKELVRRSCSGETAPSGLRERIRARIVVEQQSMRIFGSEQ